MTGDGGVADGISQGERWDSNYKRQEESCWLMHKDLSKQSWEAQEPWGRRSFASSSQCCCQDPHTSPRGHGRVCDSLLPEQPWVSVLQTHFCFLPLCLVHRASQTPACPNFPTGLRQRHAWFLCETSCARRDGLRAALPSPAQRRKSRAELTAWKRFLSFSPAVILRLIAPSTPCPHFFLLYHDSRFPPEKFPSSQRSSGGV